MTENEYVVSTNLAQIRLIIATVRMMSDTDYDAINEDLKSVNRLLTKIHNELAEKVSIESEPEPHDHTKPSGSSIQN